MEFVFYSELRTTDSSGLPGVAFVRGDSVPFGSLHRVAAGWSAGVAEGSKSMFCRSYQASGRNRSPILKAQKNTNDETLSVQLCFGRPVFFTRGRGVRRAHAGSWDTNRTHRSIFAHHFWRACRSFKVDGTEILNQARRFSMPRASIAETCRIHPRASQALDRCSFEKNKRMRDKDDAGKF